MGKIKMEILCRAIEKFGYSAQVLKLQEEALELALAISRLNCPTKDEGKMIEEFYGELADMKIMMAQAEIMFSKKKLDKVVKLKLKKLESYL
jgi:NTP pyrophosphatase (non-canonical NTP hydrolase)